MGSISLNTVQTLLKKRKKKDRLPEDTWGEIPWPHQTTKRSRAVTGRILEKFGFVRVFVYFDLHFSYFYCFLWHLFGKYWLKSKQNNQKHEQVITKTKSLRTLLLTTLHFKMKKLLTNSSKKYEGVLIIFKHYWFNTHHQDYSRSIFSFLIKNFI